MKYIKQLLDWKSSIYEQIVTDYDGSWDYKKEDGEYYTKRKGSSNWILTSGTPREAIKRKVFKDSESTQSSTSKSKAKIEPRETKVKTKDLEKPKPSTITGKIQTSWKGKERENIALLIRTMEKNGITNPHSQIGILSVVAKESGFIPKSEYSYSTTPVSRLRKLFGGKVSKYSDSDLEKLKKNDVKFYDVIYGNIAIKNGYHKWSSPKDDPVGPGDGYKYRGRGFNQITFKASYKRYAKETGVDIYINPDLLNKPETAAQFTVKFLMNRLKSKGIDANSFQTTDDAVKTFAHANTGWGRSASKVAEKQAKARKEARKFKVV